jgi:hypothetical protein
MLNTNKQFVGDWGLYPWFEERGVQLVHGEDLGEFRRLSPYGKIFLCTGEEGAFIWLAYGEQRFRVKSELFQRVSPILFPIGTRVTIRSKGIVVIVDSIQWHHRDAKPIYHVSREGKRDSRRYSAEDLRAAM